MRLYLLIFFLISVSSIVKAQEVDTLAAEEIDTILTGQEVVLVKENPDYTKQYIPRKASLYSAVLPGLGQVYNDSYWKVPIIYGGFAVLGYTVNFYQDQYLRFRENLFAELDDNPATRNVTGLDEERLRTLIERSRRERDFYMIITGVFYLLQIAEAHIDAHLKEFKLNPDLQVQVEPVIRNAQGLNTGVALKFKF